MSSDDPVSRPTKRLILATHNLGKAREFGLALPELSVETLADHSTITLPAECGATFEENAKEKAEFVSRALQEAALADDSGLLVDALPGELGVRSHRYGAGDDRDRCEKLLRALAGVPAHARSARFVCVLALAAPGRPTVVVRGEVAGCIAEKPLGQNGFGYDPVFIPCGHDRTMAEISLAEKQRISHRGRAVAEMLPAIRQHFSLETQSELHATSATKPSGE